MEKIVILGPSVAAVSGVATHLHHLLNSQLSQMFEIIHFQVGSEGREENFYLKLIRFFISPFSLIKVIFSTSASIVHVNTSIDPKAFWRDLVYVLISKALKRKIIYQIHGGKLPRDFFHDNKLLLSLLKAFFRIPDAIVVLGEVERKAYINLVPIKNLTVIPNAIDLTPFTANKKFDKEKINLVYMGRLARVKGIFDIIDAAQILIDKHGTDRIQIMFAGSGPDEEELRDYAKQKGISRVTKFTGPLFGEQKYKFWHDADIFLFPTFHQEGLPYSILESIASGTPIVTTRAGCIPDVICDGIQGFFVEEHSPEHLAATVKKMINNSSLLAWMSEKCIAKAHENYSLDRLVSQFAQLYKRVLQHKK